MNPIETLVHKYIESWNQSDAARRRATLRELYTDNANYTDPLASVTGHEAIDQLIAGVQQTFKGMVFSLAGRVDTHHDTVRFGWHLGAPGAQEPLVVGFDVAVAENGRLRQVYGFLDKVPAGV
jgi:hypothetical protein